MCKLAIHLWTTTLRTGTRRTVDHVTTDPALHDDQLETEIKLVGELVLAASQSEQHLTDQRIDEVLGLDGAGGDGAPEEREGDG